MAYLEHNNVKYVRCVLKVCVMCILNVPELHSEGLFELHSRGTPDFYPKGTYSLHYRDMFDSYCGGTAELYYRSIGSLIFMIHIAIPCRCTGFLLVKIHTF